MILTEWKIFFFIPPRSYRPIKEKMFNPQCVKNVHRYSPVCFSACHNFPQILVTSLVCVTIVFDDFSALSVLATERNVSLNKSIKGPKSVLFSHDRGVKLCQMRNFSCLKGKKKKIGMQMYFFFRSSFF